MKQHDGSRVLEVYLAPGKFVGFLEFFISLELVLVSLDVTNGKVGVK